MHVMGALISIDGLEIDEVPHDMVLVRNTIRTMHVAADARDVERLAA